MYNLGEQFKINIQRGVAKEKNILKGKTYRFTVLTERLIRLEYNEKGTFIDSPTERVLYRDLETRFSRFTKCFSHSDILF